MRAETAAITRPAQVMAGKVVLVTGGTSGIGLATAQVPSLMGAHVAVTGRDPRRTQVAALQISRGSGGLAVEAFGADLSSQDQVRRLAEDVRPALPRIDVLVSNAGGYWSHRHVTADGCEHTFAVNHPRVKHRRPATTEAIAISCRSRRPTTGLPVRPCVTSPAVSGPC